VSIIIIIILWNAQYKQRERVYILEMRLAIRWERSRDIIHWMRYKLTTHYTVCLNSDTQNIIESGLSFVGAPQIKQHKFHPHWREGEKYVWSGEGFCSRHSNKHLSPHHKKRLAASSLRSTGN
jgi:hypothetical protein